MAKEKEKKQALAGEAKTGKGDDKPKAKVVNVEKKPLPQLRPGQLVRVKQKVVEGEKERLQSFEGHVIAIRGKTDADRTMTVRRETQGYGVERIFPLANPNVVEVEVLKSARVRRAKLYYLRHARAKPLKEKAVA